MRIAKHATTITSLLIIFTIFSLFCLGCTKQETQTYTGPPTKITIGIAKGESASIVIVADQLGYFKKQGLDVNLQIFDSGVAATAALNEGKVDIAAPADFVFTSNMHDHQDLRIIAAINKINSIELIASTNKGIATPADLKGKRIAVTKTSIAEYFLGKYLNSNRLKLADITMVNMTPPMMEKEISAGSIDAAIVWSPVAQRIKQAMAGAAVAWPVQAESPWHLVLVTRDGFAKKESVALVRLMNALLLAEKSIASDPASAQRELSKRLGLPEKYFADVWHQNQFKVFLDRSLLLTLEEESRWLHKSQGLSDVEQHNFLPFLYLDALKAARAEAVTIIH